MVKKHHRRVFDSVQTDTDELKLGNKYSTRKDFTTPSDHLLSVTDNPCSSISFEKCIELKPSFCAIPPPSIFSGTVDQGHPSKVGSKPLDLQSKFI